MWVKFLAAEAYDASKYISGLQVSFQAVSDSTMSTYRSARRLRASNEVSFLKSPPQDKMISSDGIVAANRGNAEPNMLRRNYDSG
jgi:hypothetical protein